MGAIWGFVGPEGAGKTGAATYYALLHYRKGGRVLTFPGYDLLDPYKPGKDKRISTPINVDEWISKIQLGELEPGDLIFIDEIQNFFDSQRHMTIFNRLAGYASAMRRHVDISIFYTVQNWIWCYDRIRWLTHLLTTCFDLRWTAWGKDQGLERGELVSLKTWDCKGMYTGQPWGELQDYNLNLRKLWTPKPYWDSYAPIDVFAGFTKVKGIPREEIIDLREKGVPDEILMPDGPSPADRRADSGELIQRLAKEGKLTVVEAAKLTRGI